MKRILSSFLLLWSMSLQAADQRDLLISLQQAEISHLKQAIADLKKTLMDLDARAAHIEANVTNISKTKSELSGSVTVDGKTVIDPNGGWHRTYGNTGWYNQTFEGGWYMEDSTWIRAYNHKNVYTDAVVRADGGFQVAGKTVIDSNGKVAADAINVNVPVAWKAGNNGTVSCDTFCMGTQWGGWRGICVGSATYDLSRAYACSAVPKVDLKCLCGI